MSDVTFAVFRSVDDLLEQMDEKEKVILSDGKHFIMKRQKLQDEYFICITIKVYENKMLFYRFLLDYR